MDTFMQLISKKKKTNSAHDTAEYSQFRVLRVVSLGIGGILAFGAFVVLYFMYLNIFDTISKVHSIILLSNDYGSDIIDFPLYEEVKKGWNEKNTDYVGVPLPRNIFSGSVAPIQVPGPSPSNSATPIPGTSVNRSL